MNNYAVDSIIKELAFELGETPFYFICSADANTNKTASASNMDKQSQIKFLQTAIKELKADLKPTEH